MSARVVPNTELWVKYDWDERERRAREKGMNTEQRVEYAWQPRWHNRQPYCQFIQYVTQAEKSLDDRGVDFIFCTKVQNLKIIPLQVKSSIWYAERFAGIHPNIPVVTISPEDSSAVIRRKSVIAIVTVVPIVRVYLEQLGCQLPRELAL